MCEKCVRLVGPRLRQRWQDEVVRTRSARPAVSVITEAEPSQGEQLRTRQLRYLAMMGLRVVCLIGAAVAYSVHATWLIPVLIVGMVALPWMAVLIANDRPPLKARRGNSRRGTAPSRALAAPVATRVIDE